MGSVYTERPHVVCVPFPAQGHINPMLKLAKLLHQRGFHITFVNTEFNHRRLLRSRGPAAFDNLPNHFRFETIPDGLPPSEDEDSTQDVPTLGESTRRTCLGPFRRLVSKLNDAAPPVTCIVSDLIMGFTMKVAEELGIPNVLFWTASACITLNYMPSFLRITDQNDVMFNFILGEGAGSLNAAALIVNTFDKLEHDVVQSLSSAFPVPIYPLGPLNLMENTQETDQLVDSLGLNLWREETGCLEWLDSKKPNSVVYVNFGSITVMTPHQLVEFAWGLAKSGKTFLWVIRPDLVKGASAILPHEFSDEVKERGLLVGWCPQDRVLKHPSIGGFLTHCGWNSTMESLTSGVPMICWPFFADQQTNCWFVCYKWGVGLEIDSDVKRDEIDGLIRELIDGVKGKEMKERAMEWKRLGDEATQGESGEAYLNLENVINNVLLKS
ncbi:7-deoxyloganetin glucosyltransferase [Linum grandiflorum]